MGKRIAHKGRQRRGRSRDLTAEGGRFEIKVERVRRSLFLSLYFRQGLQRTQPALIFLYPFSLSLRLFHSVLSLAFFLFTFLSLSLPLPRSFSWIILPLSLFPSFLCCAQLDFLSIRACRSCLVLAIRNIHTTGSRARPAINLAPPGKMGQGLARNRCLSSTLTLRLSSSSSPYCFLLFFASQLPCARTQSHPKPLLFPLTSKDSMTQPREKAFSLRKDAKFTATRLYPQQT